MSLGLFDLTGCVAVVMGASRGIGATSAQGLFLAGAKVIGMARSVSPNWESKPNLSYVSCDMTDSTKLQTIFNQIFEQEKRIDILVNAVGVSFPSTDQTQSLSDFNQTWSINVSSAYNAAIVAAEYMRMNDGGSMIQITSINSVLGFPGNPGYVASKGGLRMLTKALAVDLAKDKIRVNAIAPGYIRTDMTEKSYQDPVLNQQRLNHMLIPRWGEPSDLIGAVIFLASSASKYITGQDIFVDGGWTCRGLV